VKPFNVLIARGGHCYLADFGLIRDASDRSDLTPSGQLLGSVDYAAPEQIEGKDVDGRADIYSLGCVLYECLAGKVRSRRTPTWPCSGHTFTSRRHASTRTPTSTPSYDAPWPRKLKTATRPVAPWSKPSRPGRAPEARAAGTTPPLPTHRAGGARPRSW
jgi:serine/threonine-protein kinase